MRSQKDEFRYFFQGRTKLDYSDGMGFYLSYDIKFAESWMRSRIRQTSFGAILIFTVKKIEFQNFLKDFKGLELKNSGTVKDFEEVITYYRSGRSANYPDCLKAVCKNEGNIDYIEGPISSFNQSHTREQFCIKSKNMARKFSFLKKVLFFKSS